MNKIRNDNLIKNSAIIAITNSISLLQRKIFNYLIASAYFHMDKKDIFTISINELKEIVWFNSKNILYLKESLKGIMATVVEFNILWKDKESWSATTLLSSVEFEEWKCIYSFSPTLRKKLHQPNIYAKLELSVMKLFTSKYSLALYELFIDYAKIWQTPIISLSDFKKLMGIEEFQYTEFKRLSLRVIKPALKEVNELISFVVSVEYKRENRKVVALKFYFKEIIKTKQDIQNDKVLKNYALRDKLINEFWLWLRQAQNIIKIYPTPYIKESLEIIKHKIFQKVVKNIPAYTITVLKNDYIPVSNKQEQPLLSNSKKDTWWKFSNWNWLENTKGTTGMNLLHHADNNYVSKIQKKAQKYFESLSKEEQQTLVKKFEDEKITSDILKILYKKEWIKSTIFRIMFENYITSIL